MPETVEDACADRTVGLLTTTPTADLAARLFEADKHVFQSNATLAIANSVRSGLGIGPVIDTHAAFGSELQRCRPDVRMRKETRFVSTSELRESGRLKAVYDLLGDQLSAVVNYLSTQAFHEARAPE